MKVHLIGINLESSAKFPLHTAHTANDFPFSKALVLLVLSLAGAISLTSEMGT